MTKDYHHAASALSNPPADRPVTQPSLSRREREIMDIVHRRGRATAVEIHADLTDPPHAAAVRTLLRILEDKGHLQHDKEGPRHVYFSAVPRPVAQRSALKHLLGTFFAGSRTAAVAALLDERERPLTAAERRQLDEVLTRLRASGR